MINWQKGIIFLEYQNKNEQNINGANWLDGWLTA